MLQGKNFPEDTHLNMLWGRRGRMWWRGGKGPKSHTQRNTLHPSVKTLDTNKIPYYSLTKNWYMTLSSSSMSTNCVLKTMPLTHPPPQKSIPPPLSPSSRATTNTIPYPLKHAHKDPVHQPPTREIVELCNKNYTSLFFDIFLWTHRISAN